MTKLRADSDYCVLNDHFFGQLFEDHFLKIYAMFHNLRSLEDNSEGKRVPVHLGTTLTPLLPPPPCVSMLCLETITYSFEWKCLFLEREDYFYYLLSPSLLLTNGD